MPAHSNKPGQHVTISDIAELAGVSRSTVSRAFSRPEMLSQATVAKVKAAAEKSGYIVNHAARALSTGRFGNIAVVVPDIANPFFPPLVRQVQSHADSAGYAVFLGDSDEVAEREASLMSRLSPQVDGFILAASRLDEASIRSFDAVRPIVLVNRDISGLACVLIDPTGGLDEAVEHLHNKGHRSIIYLAGPEDSWSDQQRRKALGHAASRKQVQLQIHPVGRPSRDAGRDAVSTVVESGATAVLAFDDIVAQGVLEGLAVRGLDVPGFLSVIGCDDTLAAGTNPPLTTISAASAAAGAAAVEPLLQRIGGLETPNRRITIPTHLVLRATTGASRHSK